MRTNGKWLPIFIIVAFSNLIMSVASSQEISLGDSKAPVTIIEYGSLTCGDCLSFHRDVFPLLKKQYIDTGTVRFIFRHFPTSGSAVYAARSAQCTGEKYYEMIDMLMSSVVKWYKAESRDRDNLFLKLATSLGVDSETFRSCISDEKLVENILFQQRSAKKDLGVIGTPTSIINGKVVPGEKNFDEIKALISNALLR